MLFSISDYLMSASEHITGMLDRDQRTVRCGTYLEYKRHRRVKSISDPSPPVTINLTTMLPSSSSSSSSSPTTSSSLSSGPSNSSSCSTNLTTVPNSSPVSPLVRMWWTPRLIKNTDDGCCEKDVFKRRCGNRTRKTRQSSWRITQRLRHLLVFLLSINYFPLISSAPTSKHNMSDRMNSHPKWINPCGMGQTEVLVHDSVDSVTIADRDLLSQIILTASIALTEAENFREDYVEKTFSTDFQEHHKLWKSHGYDWLPTTEQIPKILGEDAPGPHLESLQLDKSLLDTYEYLQKIAVGLEQLVWDQEDDSAPFYGKFKDIEFKLRALLCEIQVAILERGVVMRPDVRRDIMTEAYRNTENMSQRYLRDWFIFRDFMNALEYVIQVFSFLQKNL